MTFWNDFDRKVFFAVHNLQKFNLDLILGWPTCFGSISGALPVIFIFTLLQSRRKIILRYLFAISPILISHYLVEFLKIYFAVPRPFIVFNAPEELVHVLFNRPHNFSFPSGHASTGFALATLLASYFKVNHYVAYSLGILICVTRLYVGVHFPSDVIVGAFIGWAITAFFLKIFTHPVLDSKKS